MGPIFKNVFLSKKFCIWETKNFSTDADRRTDTILGRLHDFFFMWGVGMQNSALSKQSAAVKTMYLILTIEVDGELGKVKGIKSYL